MHAAVLRADLHRACQNVFAPACWEMHAKVKYFVDRNGAAKEKVKNQDETFTNF